jgi:hypothetical protein
MAGTAAVMGELQLQNSRFRGFRHHSTDQCVRTPDTCRFSKEGVPSISVISNSHSVIKTNHNPCKLSELKKTRQKQQAVVTHVSWRLVLEHMFIEDC